jgi:hypothetical protein
MKRRFVLVLLASVPIMIRPSAQAQARNAQPRYAPVTLCEISNHKEWVNPKRISLEAEYVNAIPHGLFLIDHRCTGKALQIDFPDSGLDPSVAFIKDHLLGIHRANGIFRGILKRDRVTNRRYLWLQSVVNFQTADYLPELHKDKPIQLPEQPWPKWPPSP